MYFQKMKSNQLHIKVHTQLYPAPRVPCCYFACIKLYSVHLLTMHRFMVPPIVSEATLVQNKTRYEVNREKQAFQTIENDS